ncbi:TetR/AcrR family transcriptional regulator [Paenirhodobacter ferrireducens]|nr:TetR/AcrR family transcriptional regulator [Sinirhodobacter ferrireducens]
MEMKPGHDERPARQRILDVAISRFSCQTFSEVSLRDIARDAQVDVAYVHRAFGSKVGLFRQALEAGFDFDAVFAEPVTREGVIRRLCEQMTARNPRTNGEAGPIDLVLRSCTNAETRDILRELSIARFHEPMIAKFGGEMTMRVMLAISLLFGTVTQRNALGIEPLASTPDEELRAAVYDAMMRLLA